jgi:hypothetical protein
MAVITAMQVENDSVRDQRHTSQEAASPKSYKPSRFIVQGVSE